MPTVRNSPRAVDDIGQIAGDLLQQGAGVMVTDKFVEDLEERFEAHARQPLMGSLCEDPGDDLRCFSFRRNSIAVYRPRDDGIDVLRRFHSARDYGRLFRGER